MNSDCIFCKIIAGDIPATRIYEDDHVLAFMDINPVIHGHALVIPKTHYDPITDTPDEVLGQCMAAVKRVSQAQITALGAEGVNIHQANGAVAGQVVPHIHFHVIPRFDGDGHHWNWTHRDYSSMDEMIAIGDKLKQTVASSHI